MGGRKGGGGHTPYEAPESGQSKQFVSIVEIVSEGQIKGLVDGVKSVYLNNTSLQASDDSYNFKNVEAQGRIGTQDQEVMEGFNTSEKEIAVSTQVKKLTPITRTITDRKVSRLRLTLGVQSLFHQNDKGDVYGSKVDFTVTIGERSHLVSISGKYSSQYLKQVEFGDLPPVPFQVKVERVNADSKSQRLQNNTIWASYTEIIETQFAYPNTAILGIRFDSEYFSSIPNRTYEIYGIEMKVPSNYDPFERTYTGFWDGTFKIAWTNNPAWILYDLMTNKRYGLGWRLGEFNVDKWALYQAAQYCDQMVPDGFGGQEPRFTCNAWLTDQRKAYDVINDICSIFRAMPVWNGREFTVVMDRPADPVWTYTNANVISGEFSYQYSAQKARHNEIHIEYIDADDSYERKIEVVSDDDLIRRHGLNVKKVTAFACTSRGQAFRTGKWILETERLETKTVTFAVGAEGLMHIPGDIIRVADCDYADTNIGGRVLDINGNKVTLDREIEISENSYFTYINSEAKHKDIRIVSKNGKEVMLESEPVGLAELGVWSLTTQEINVQLFRALTINEEEQGQYTIVALQHEPQKEAIVDNGAVFEPRETTLSTAGLDKVSHVNVQANGDGVALSFDYVVKHSAMVKYQIKLYKAGTFYKIYDDLTSPNYKFTGLPDGEYTAEIRAKNEQGQLSEAVTKSFNISFAVSELTTVSKVFGILLQWKNPVFANPNSAIEIWTSTDNQFENARKLVSLSYPTSEYLFSGLGVNEKHYFWVRMIDTANGNAGEFTKSVVGTSEKSGKKLVEYIQGQVTKSTLAKDLAQEITQIQATASEATDSAKMALSRIDSEATTRAEQIKQEGESIKASVRKEYEKNASAISNLEKTTQDHAQEITQIQATASEATDSAKMALSRIDSEATTRAEQIKQEGESIKASVRKEYEKNASAISNLEKTTQDHALQISTVHSKFNQLEIGGRNLLKHSEKLNKNWGKNSGATIDLDLGVVTLTANGRLVALSQELIEDQVEVKDGKVVLSFDALSNKSGKLNLRLRRYTGSTYSDISAYVTVDSRDYKRYSVVFDYQKSEGQTRLSVEIVTYEKDGTVFNIKKPKLELGNIATDWTPAPEDVDVAISEVSADIIQHKQSQATVNKSTADKLDSLTARVGLSESEIQLIQKTASEKDKSFSTKLETLDSKVAQNTSGISDLKETKASKDEVASLARKELKSEWTDEVNATKLDLTSKITALEQTVSNENKSLAVKSETLEAKFNQLQIGGRNLLKQTRTLNSWNKNGGVTLDTDHDIATLTANGRLVALSQELIEDQVEVKDGKVVLSFDALSNKSGKLNLRLRRYTGSTYSDISAYVTVDSRDYKRYSVVFDYQKSEGQTRLSVEIVTYEKDGTVFNIKKPKLELGNIATDWTPAPEDVDVAISEVSADIIQHKQSQATVNKSTADKLDSLTARVGLSESEIQLIQKTASEKDKSFSTKLETLDSKVAQNTSGISDLKETKASKDEVASLARKELKSEWTDEVNATKLDLTSKITALEQTVSNENKSLAVKSETLEAKFNQLQIGGRNLLKQTRTLNSWNKNGGVTLDTDHDIATLTANGRLVALSQELIEDQVEVKDGKVVLSFDALSNKSGKLNLRLRRYTGSTYSDISAYVTVDSRDYKRYSVVFDYQKSEGQTRLSVEIVTYEKDGTVFNIKKPKLELGNIATDWTPAPEDVDVAISEVSADIIQHKQSQATVNKSTADKLDSLTARVGLSESEIQLIQKTASEKDKSFSTKLETLDSKVAQNTSGISDLKETKASKDEVASLARKELKSEWTDEVNATKLDLTSKITALEQTVSNENKSLAVKSETLEAKFNQLQIGGRNLLKQTRTLNSWNKNGGVTLDTDHDIATLTANGRLVALSQELIEDQVEVKDGKVVLSFDALSNKSGKLNLRLRRYTGSTYSDISAYVTVDSRDYKRYSVVFDYQKSEGQTRLSVEIVTYEKDGTVFNIKKPKLELGNIATDWTPAPEDVDVAISEVSADIIQHKQSQATVNKSTADKLDSLTARVGLSESEIQLIQKTASEKDKSFSTKLETLDSKVAQNTSGISDLKETKASKDEVASLARKELKSEWTDEVNATKLDLTSKITALEQTVSNENKSLAVKSETLEAKFNQLQIGGRNLLKQTRTLNSWNKNGGVTLDTDHDIATLTANGRLVALSQELIEDQVEVKDGKVVLSFDALSNKSGKLNLRLRRYTGSTYSDISAYVTVDSRDYKRYSVVFDYQKSEGQTRLSVEIVTYEKDGTVFNIKKPKLELGNIATDWTPAPEDVDSTLSEVNASISSLKNTTAEKEKAFSQEVSTVKAEIVGAKALITSSSQAISSLDGKVQSMYTLKTETVAGGRKAIAGIALGADGQTAESQVIIFANKFAIADPNSNALKTPFVISTHNGRSQVALAGDLIVDDSITGNKIQANSTITAPNINGGVVNGGSFTGGSIDIGNGNFTVDSTGNLTAKNGVFSGRLDGATGRFKGELEVTKLIGGGVIEQIVATMTKTGTRSVRYVYYVNQRDDERAQYGTVYVPIYAATIRIDPYPVDRYVKIGDELSFVLKANQAFTKKYERVGTFLQDNEYVTPVDPDKNLLIISYALSDTGTISFS
uniref:TipJ family phage tail tip protein n=1 Tax=Pasteurella multocida TaxID=747 RepID=UPI00403DEA83